MSSIPAWNILAKHKIEKQKNISGWAVHCECKETPCKQWACYPNHARHWLNAALAGGAESACESGRASAVRNPARRSWTNRTTWSESISWAGKIWGDTRSLVITSAKLMEPRWLWQRCRRTLKPHQFLFSLHQNTRIFAMDVSPEQIDRALQILSVVEMKSATCFSVVLLILGGEMLIKPLRKLLAKVLLSAPAP